jgi:hypothetical protein
MKDLEKMRVEFEKSLKLAEIENEFESKYNVSCVVFESCGKIHVCSSGVAAFNKLAGKILRDLPADTPRVINDTAIGTDNPIEELYKLESHRGYKDSCSILSIEFAHKGIWYTISLKIDGVEALEQFFNVGYIKMGDTEISTYKPIRNGRLVEDLDIPCRTFKCSQKTYYGGRYVCTDHEAIRDIIGTIKQF